MIVVLQGSLHRVRHIQNVEKDYGIREMEESGVVSAS
jgi:hypothetical protein